MPILALVAQIVIDMATPENQGLITEAGLFIITESGDYIVTEAFTTQGGGKAKPPEIKEDNSELWEIGASIYKINDNSLKEPLNIKKYITEENDIKVIIGENIYIKRTDVITENVTAQLVSKKIRE